MKWLIILSVPIIFSISIVNAKSESDNHDCAEKHRNQTRITQSCMRQLINISEVMNDFETTLVQYSGDDAAVHAFANKYCPKLKPLMDCSIVGQEVYGECIDPLYHMIDQQRFHLYKAVINYVCADNATAVLLRVVANDGLGTIYMDKRFEGCFKLGTRVQNKIDVLTTADLCVAVDKVFKCYTDYVQDHKNADLTTIANELQPIFRKVLKCESTN